MSGSRGLPSQLFRADQSIADASAVLARLFGEAGLETPQRDARILLQGVLGIDGAALLSGSHQPLGADAAAGLDTAARRRLAHEPVSRILGRRAFYGRDFIVTPDVLDPRADTEAVIELALDIVRSDGLSEQALSIADIGTGSGILIVTLLAELRNARGIATDVSPEALAVARRNADALGVGDRVRFIATSGLDGCGGDFDLVIANPPYISTGEIAGLDRDVKEFDPLVALDGGVDGLSVYREIARNTLKLKRPSRIVLEVGAAQADAVEDIFVSYGARRVGRRKDLGGHIRAVALEIHLQVG